jgi:hypothetical protein
MYRGFGGKGPSLSASEPSPDLPSSVQPPKGGAFILALVPQATTFAAAQAVGAIEDAASLATPRTTEPCAPPAEPRRGPAGTTRDRGLSPLCGRPRPRPPPANHLSAVGVRKRPCNQALPTVATDHSDDPLSGNSPRRTMARLNRARSRALT